MKMHTAPQAFAGWASGARISVPQAAHILAILALAAIHAAEPVQVQFPIDNNLYRVVY
jgi:hypothetical protein